MNKFIQLPLFLSCVCLLSGGLLSGVFALTEDTIAIAKEKKRAQAYSDMYSSSDIELISKQIEIIGVEGLMSVVLVSHNGLVSAVYECESTSRYEVMNFFIGFDKESLVVDGYYVLDTSESSLGYGTFKDNATVMGSYQDYDGSQNVIFSGVSYTSEAVKKCVDDALNDLKNRKWEM